MGSARPHNVLLMQVNALIVYNLYVSAMHGAWWMPYEHKRGWRKLMGGEYDVGAAELRELAENSMIC